MDLTAEAEAMLELMREMYPESVSRSGLAAAAQCEVECVDHHLTILRKHLEAEERRKVCNSRGVGYRLDSSVSDQLDECLKHVSRMRGHFVRAAVTVQKVIDEDQIQKEDDAEAYAFCSQLVRELDSAKWRELESLLASREAKRRAKIAKQETSAP